MMQQCQKGCNRIIVPHRFHLSARIFCLSDCHSEYGFRLSGSLMYNPPVMADIFLRWKTGLARSSKAAFGRLAGIFGATEITAETWEELEAMLIQADVGLETTEAVIESLRGTVRSQGLTRSSELREGLESELRRRLDVVPALDLAAHPTVILLVGVNGSGKTTSAAKLGWRFANEGKQVLLVAADTFRAAAVDQLQVWAERLELPIIAGQMGSDPGAVVYDGIHSAIRRVSIWYWWIRPAACIPVII